MYFKMCACNLLGTSLRWVHQWRKGYCVYLSKSTPAHAYMTYLHVYVMYYVHYMTSMHSFTFMYVTLH